MPHQPTSANGVESRRAAAPGASTTDLGAFLRARRGRVSPGQVGLPTSLRRRVSGLRREEVATLCGLSVDYYVRLEQGRERRPSSQVLTALAEVLLLGTDERLHLFSLAGLAPRLPLAPPEQVDPDLQRLVDAWSHQPALLLGRTYDVLARNALGKALWSPFTYSENLLLNVFLDPAAREFYRDWPAAALGTVAGFRVAAGAGGDDPRVHELLDHLHQRSKDFVRIWEEGDARGKAAETKTLVHPQVGAVTLSMQTFDVRSSPGQQLVVYHAEPGSAAAEALALLGSWAATASPRS